MKEITLPQSCVYHNKVNDWITILDTDPLYPSLCEEYKETPQRADDKISLIMHNRGFTRYTFANFIHELEFLNDQSTAGDSCEH